MAIADSGISSRIFEYLGAIPGSDLRSFLISYSCPFVVRYSVRVVFDTGHSHSGENHKSTRVDTNKRAKDRPTKQAKDARKARRIFGSEDFFACLVGNGW